MHAPDLAFLTRKVRIYFPFATEFPAEMLALGGLPEARINEARSLPLVRVAKTGGEVIGAYLIAPEAGPRYRLEALAVVPAYRGRGVGSWLIGHAIGVAEAKGGRIIVCTAGTPADSLLDRLGFTCTSGERVLELTPE
ncbi:MAG: GNAT family N-acetyltransferase [Pseudomonadales bacterium]|nr:GNAT family N-acetyltransferase [Pseudomonadales bacterium]MCP5184337.1 GNAT family N-acetyltransferase [Pseudomonadales bacterium]